MGLKICIPLGKWPVMASSSGRNERSRSPVPARKKSNASTAAAGADPARLQIKHLEVPHFKVTPGEWLGPGKRYYVRKLLGEGTFGRVVDCVDMVEKKAVAIKVVKGVQRYCDYAEAEAEVLREIVRCDPGHQSRCVRLLTSFIHNSLHNCLVFDRLGVSLHEFMAKEC